MSKNARKRTPITRCCDGAAAVEFALVVIPLLLLVLGAVEFGRALNIQNQVHRAADVGARALLIDPNASAADIQTRMRQVLQIVDGNKLAVTVQPQTINGQNYRTLVATFPVQPLVTLIIKSSYTITVRRSTVLQ